MTKKVQVTQSKVVSLINMASSPDIDIRALAASNPSLRPDLLSMLAEDSSVEVRVAVASNPSAAPHILDILSQEPAGRVKEAVAGNEATTAAVLRRLAGTTAARVRMAVAGNPGTPRDVLSKLASDTNRDVRHAAANNDAGSLELGEQTEVDESHLPDGPGKPKRLALSLSEKEYLQFRRLLTDRQSRTTRPVRASALIREAMAEKVARDLEGPASQTTTKPRIELQIPPGSTPAQIEKVFIRAVDRTGVRRNLEQQGTSLVDLTDILLQQLDAVLAPTRFGDNNPPIGNLDEHDLRSDLEELRETLRLFRDSLAAAVAAPATKTKPAVKMAAQVFGALAAMNELAIVRVPVVAGSALGFCFLAQSLGIPLTPDIVMTSMLGAAEGGKIAHDRANKKS